MARNTGAKLAAPSAPSVPKWRLIVPARWRGRITFFTLPVEGVRGNGAVPPLRRPPAQGQV